MSKSETKKERLKLTQGFTKEATGTLYLNSISIDGVIVCYKIGVTNRSAESRRKDMMNRGDGIKVRNVFRIKMLGADVLQLESNIKKLYADPSFYKKYKEIKSGKTELISIASAQEVINRLTTFI